MSEAPDFGTFGRFEETSVGDMPADMKEAYNFTMKLRGLVPGPHRIWLANPELSKTVVPIGAYYRTRSTLRDAMGLSRDRGDQAAFANCGHGGEIGLNTRPSPAPKMPL
jgi:hypothetical protein